MSHSSKPAKTKEKKEKGTYLPELGVRYDFWVMWNGFKGWKATGNLVDEPKEPFIGYVLPSKAAEDYEKSLTWEEIDVVAYRALAQGDVIARQTYEHETAGFR